MEKTIYFVMSTPCGRQYCRGYLNELPTDIIELLDNGYNISLWDITGHDPETLCDNLPYGMHNSFAFSNMPELCSGDYI
jgi:hypothetical protein